MTKGSPTWRQQLGSLCESRARHFLESQGLQLLARNYRCKMGEIDLIMLDHSIVVFIEVRYRRCNSHGTAAESVDARKQARIRLAARQFLLRYRQYSTHVCRFDVLALELNNSGDRAIHWIPNAFY